MKKFITWNKLRYVKSTVILVIGVSRASLKIIEDYLTQFRKKLIFLYTYLIHKSCSMITTYCYDPVFISIVYTIYNF